MLLIAALGNPGNRYVSNRHNIGWMVGDAIARRYDFGPFKNRFQAEIAEGLLGGESVLLVKPQSFMNLSGESVMAAMRFRGLVSTDVVVVHDELNLPAGELRFKTGGGHGGHNGLRSLHHHLGEMYHRIRIGIGHPGDKAAVIEYVLGDFTPQERAWVDSLIVSVADAAPLLGKKDWNGFCETVGARQISVRN